MAVMISCIKHIPPLRAGKFCFISLIMHSVADTCIIPVRDYLGLDNTARMNALDTVGNNWCWCLNPSQVTEELEQKYWLC